jgi:hypothetical protein
VLRPIARAAVPQVAPTLHHPPGHPHHVAEVASRLPPLTSDQPRQGQSQLQWAPVCYEHTAAPSEGELPRQSRCRRSEQTKYNSEILHSVERHTFFTYTREISPGTQADTLGQISAIRTTTVGSKSVVPEQTSKNNSSILLCLIPTSLSKVD